MSLDVPHHVPRTVVRREQAANADGDDSHEVNARTEPEIEVDASAEQSSVPQIATRDLRRSVARGAAWIGGIIVGMAALVLVNTFARGNPSLEERVLLSSFVVFATGFALLLAVLVVNTLRGKIKLLSALQDKPHGNGDMHISLSRLQAFLWTLICMTTYFAEAVLDKKPGLPTIPPEMLMVMGISSAVYLTSKGIASKQQASKGGAS